MKNNSRRYFLTQSMKMLGLMGISSVVSENFLQNIINQAHANSILDDPDVKNSLRYIHITMAGAPPRWYFDLPLTPSGQTSSNFIQGGFGNKFEISGQNVEVVHSAWRHAGSGLHLPPVWNMNAAGKNFSNILKYTGFIRGIDNEIDSHSLSNARQVSPVIGGYTLSGANADERKNPISAVNLNGASAGAAFKSRKSLSSNSLGITSNPITTLLNPFRVKANSSVHSGGTKQLVDQVISQINQEAKSLKVQDSAISETHENAKSLIEAGVQSLSDQYPTVFAKYRTLVEEAARPAKGSLPGFFDKAIPGKQDDPRYRFGTTTTYAYLPDMRDAVNAQTNITNMAAQFAVLEILITTGITSTVVANFPGVTRFKFSSSSNSGTVTHDQHNYGTVIQNILNTLYYRSMLTCLTELVSVLEANALINKTLIHIASEFNRSPRADGSGADHGVTGSNATLISGMIKGPFVIGNIKIDSNNATYKGTWGVAADYALDNEVRPIKVNDVARTITSMLRTTDIVTNGYSLLNPVNGHQWAPKKLTASNV